MTLARTRMEMGFAINPSEFTNLLRSPLPMASLAVDLGKAITNFNQETWDLIHGTENKRDNTPFGYYTFRLVPGFTQMSRILELYEQDKINPYKNKNR